MNYKVDSHTIIDYRLHLGIFYGIVVENKEPVTNSSDDVRDRAIPCIRLDIRQMGKIQPGYAAYINSPHWTVC